MSINGKVANQITELFTKFEDVSTVYICNRYQGNVRSKFFTSLFNLFSNNKFLSFVLSELSVASSRSTVELVLVRIWSVSCSRLVALISIDCSNSRASISACAARCLHHVVFRMSNECNKPTQSTNNTHLNSLFSSPSRRSKNNNSDRKRFFMSVASFSALWSNLVFSATSLCSSRMLDFTVLSSTSFTRSFWLNCSRRVSS